MQTRCRAIPPTTHNPLCITIEGREWNIQTTIRDPTMHSQTITQQQHVHSLFPNRLLQRIRFILLLSLFFTFSLLQTNTLLHKTFLNQVTLPSLSSICSPLTRQQRYANQVSSFLLSSRKEHGPSTILKSE